MKHHNNYARVYSGQSHALGGIIISVEVDVSSGLHSFTIVGLANKAVEEARDRVSSALKNSGLPSPKQENKKVVVSLAPAELKKEGACYDCAIALGYLLAQGKINQTASNTLFIGELSLDGTIQPTQEILSIMRSAAHEGITQCFIPALNAPIASLIPGLTIYPVSHLSEVVNHFALYPEDQLLIKPIPSTELSQKLLPGGGLVSDSQLPLFSSIAGHSTAKRALQIAAAGGHNLLLIGAPGTGKTLLAKSLQELLPRLSHDASLEVTIIHGNSTRAATAELITIPPFRAPHHTSSATSIIGGGTSNQPGELSLAHHGILFLDEFPEFDRRVIESLRQPLEEGIITVARSKGVTTLPAQTLLVAAMNPCPCGYFGSSHTSCTCTPAVVERYRKKISGPIMDRIDLWISVEAVSSHTLHTTQRKPQAFPPNEIIPSILRARKLQQYRTGSYTRYNAHLTPEETAALSMTPECRELIIHAGEHYHLSPRAQHRLIKVARTIADLTNAEVIEKEHLLEALQYRNLQ